MSADSQGWIPFNICSILMSGHTSKRGPNPAPAEDLNSPIRSKYMEEFLSRQVRATNPPINSPIRSKYMEEFFSRQVRATNPQAHIRQIRATNLPEDNSPVRSKYMEEFLSRQV